MTAGVLIVGAGQAGAQLALSLREYGQQGPITLVGDESHLPYQRPPLSKEYMTGALRDLNDVLLRGADVYRREEIALVTGTSVVRVDRAEKSAILSDARRLPYDTLVLATGCRPRSLFFAGERPRNVHELRSADDAQRLRQALSASSRLLVIGAGFIGLELASVAVQLGADVTVVEAGDRVMARAISPEMSAYFEAQHRDGGVAIHCGTSVEGFSFDDVGMVSAARIAGRDIRVDLVVVGIGVVPNAELASEAGLATEAGILVDGALRTADPAIYAIGDCARFPVVGAEAPVRLESVPNAADQARYLARRLATGTLDEYISLAWFWSVQAAQRLQIAGLAQPEDDSVMLGDAASGKFSVARIRGGVVVAVETVNDPATHLSARRVLARPGGLNEAELRHPEFSLRTPPAGAERRVTV